MLWGRKRQEQKALEAVLRIETKRISETITSIDGEVAENVERVEAELQRHAFKAPLCPRCRSKTSLRTASQGRHYGELFWGCSRYFEKYNKCKGIVSFKDWIPEELR